MTNEQPVSAEARSGSLRATVAIPTYNGETYLPAILDALRIQKFEGGFEVLVIDSGSTDRTLEIVAAYPEVRLHQIPNAEFSHGGTRQLAVELARGEIVAFLTHDAVPTSDRWLYELTKPFELSERVAVVTGKQIARPTCFPVQKYDIARAFGMFGPDYSTSLFYADSTLPGEPVLNALSNHSDVNGAVRRRVVLDEVPFQPIHYAEDHMLARDLIEAGYIRAFAPRAAVWHSNDITLAEYDNRLFDEVVGLRTVGLTVPAVSFPARLKHIAGQVLRDVPKILRDRDYSLKRKLYYLAVNPLYAWQRWAGYQRGATVSLQDAAARQTHSLEHRRKSAE